MSHWSHSSIEEILNNPASYYLSHIQKIKPKEKKKPFVIGSAVHYALEKNTSELEEYFKKEGLLAGEKYEDYMILCEVMAESFLNSKQKFLKEILNEEKILIEEHELELLAPMKSQEFKEDNNFLGIIDLFLVTNKGIIIVDYKTSSSIPNWNDYLEQLYRYNFLVKYHFPDQKIYKFAIINLIKSSIKMINGESLNSYRNRLRRDYRDGTDLINIHVYDANTFNEKIKNDYITKLAKDMDRAQIIKLNNLWNINKNALIGRYGRCEYYDIFTHEEYAYVKYVIEDKIYDSVLDKILTERNCKKIDMMVLDKPNVLNKYDSFKLVVLGFYATNQTSNKELIFKFLKNNFIVDNDLLEMYWKTFVYELKMEK